MPESEEGWLVPTQTSGEGYDLTATSPPGTVENAYSSREPTGMQALNRSIHSASEAHNLLGSGSQTSTDTVASISEWADVMRRSHAANDGGCGGIGTGLMRLANSCQRFQGNQQRTAR
jgi:hypothetical protein